MKKYLGLIIGFVFGPLSVLVAPYTFALFITPLSTALSKIPMFSRVDLFESGFQHAFNYWAILFFIGIFWALIGLVFQYLISKRHFLYLAVFIILLTYIFRFSFDKFYEFDYVRIANSNRITANHAIKIPITASSSTLPSVGSVDREWDYAVKQINDCNVKSVMQTHSLSVSIDLKDGSSFRTKEPSIDLVMDEVNKNSKKCGSIIMATE